MSQRPLASRDSQNGNSTHRTSFFDQTGKTASPLTTGLSESDVEYKDGGPVQATNQSMSSGSAQNQIPTGAQSTASRSLGVQSILNPSQPESRADPVSDQGQFTQLPTSYTTATTLPSLLPPLLVSPQGRKRSEPEHSQGNPLATTSTRNSRRVLTPKSPSVRATSLGASRHASQGGLQSSSLSHEGRIYTAEPGQSRDSEIPPLPNSTSGGSTGLPRLQTALETAGQPALAQYSERPINVPGTKSESDSPNMRRFSYGSTNRSSPVVHYGTPSAPQASYRPSQAALGSGYGQVAQPSPAQEAPYTMTQGSYQMTLDTEQGPIIVPVELDLQQASKVADEKRKRNAGASARFRARRKEKEQQASVALKNYERDVQELQEARDFYINERNFFRDLVARSTGPASIPPRPRSPQLRIYESGFSTSGDRSSQSRERSEAPSTSQRRRTGDYQPSFRAQPTASPMMPPQMPQLYSINLPPPPALAAPDVRSALPPPGQASVSRSQSYDPLRQNPYDRSWNPGR